LEDERSQIIESYDVIKVMVSDQNRIDVFDSGSHRLLPEIRSCVNQNVDSADTDETGASKS